MHTACDCTITLGRRRRGGEVRRWHLDQLSNREEPAGHLTGTIYR